MKARPSHPHGERVSFPPNVFRSVRVNNVDIRFIELGTGTPLVLLHPLRMQLEYFYPLLAELDLSEFHVFVPDLPGHGLSDAPRTEYTAEFFTDVVGSLLDSWGIMHAVLVGESIGASIALTTAARGHARIAKVIALNPYDYGRRGGIRRSSFLANVVFTTMLWPLIGLSVASVRNRRVLRAVLRGAVQDRRSIPAGLIDTLNRCGALDGHPRAFRSLMVQWRTWLATRDRLHNVHVPVALVYGERDWSTLAERQADADAIPNVVVTTIADSRHFLSLERPAEVASLISKLKHPSER